MEMKRVSQRRRGIIREIDGKVLELGSAIPRQENIPRKRERSTVFDATDRSSQMGTKN